MNPSVTYPAARWEVMLAVAALADREYQESVWIKHELPHEDYYDSLDQTIHTLFDDWPVLPRPHSAVGPILTDGPELARLHSLGEVLGALLADLGDRSDEEYLNDGRWPLVIDCARAALAAMVLAGPIDRLLDDQPAP